MIISGSWIRKIILACISIVNIFIISCASSKLPPDVSPEALELARKNPQLYISQLEEQRPPLASIAARYKLRMRISDKWYTLKQVTLIKYPNLIRMEFSSSFGMAQALMVSDEERVNFYLLKERHYYTAQPTAENFFKLIGIRLEAQDLNDLLLNQYLSSPEAPPQSIHWDAKLNLIVIKQEQKELQREIIYYINPKIKGILIIRIVDLKNNQEVLRAHYSNYRIEGDIIFPREISLKMPTEDIELILQAKDIEFNVKNISLDSFKFNPQHNATQTNLELLRDQAAILLKRIS